MSRDGSRPGSLAHHAHLCALSRARQVILEKARVDKEAGWR